MVKNAVNAINELEEGIFLFQLYVYCLNNLFLLKSHFSSIVFMTS